MCSCAGVTATASFADARWASREPAATKLDSSGFRHDDSAAHRHAYAGHEACEIRGQKRDHVGDVLIIAAPSERHGTFVERLHLVPLPAILVGDDPARGDLIDRDAMLSELSRQRTHHAVHGAF